MFYVFIKSNFIMFIILTTIYLDLILFCVFFVAILCLFCFLLDD